MAAVLQFSFALTCLALWSRAASRWRICGLAETALCAGVSRHRLDLLPDRDLDADRRLSLAYALVRTQNAILKSTLLVIVVTPLFLGEVVRTYSWIIVLGNNGFIIRC